MLNSMIASTMNIKPPAPMMILGRLEFKNCTATRYSRPKMKAARKPTLIPS